MHFVSARGEHTASGKRGKDSGCRKGSSRGPRQSPLGKRPETLPLWWGGDFQVEFLKINPNDFFPKIHKPSWHEMVSVCMHGKGEDGRVGEGRIEMKN